MAMRWDPGSVTGLKRLQLYLRLVRIEHTLFSLPFALIGLLVARATSPMVYLLAFLSLLGLRASAMAFNNLADVDIDALNPRTRQRPLVQGLISEREVLALIALFTLLYYASAYAICIPALLYATPLYILALSYPYAKRVHPLPHLHLGLVLGMAVFGGWVAGACSTGCLDPIVLLVKAPWLIVAGVAFWVAGFDIVYAVMDYEFDSSVGIGSLPARIGVRAALYTALAFETLSAALWTIGGLIYMGVYAAASSLLAGTIAVYSVLLALRDTRLIPKAFNLNLSVGFIALTGFILNAVV